MLSPRGTLWRNRSLRFLIGASASLVSAVGGVIRNKWLAQHLETSGLGVLAQVFSGQAWLGTATGLGLGLPVARAVGLAMGSGDSAGMRRTVWAAFSLLAISGAVAISCGLIFAARISQALLGSTDYAPLVRISMVGTAGIALQQTLTGLFAGRSDLRAPLTFAVVGGGIATLATLLLVPRLGLLGGALGAAIGFPAGCLGALYFHRREYAPAILPVPRPSLTPEQTRALLGVATAGLLASLVEQGTLLGLRSNYLRWNGVAANGLLQAALALSQQVGALFYAYLASYAFGKISGIQGSQGASGTRDYTRRHWAPLILAAAAAFAVAMVAASPLLRLLYSHRFDPARPLMAWTLFGEFGRVALQTWALGALPLGGMRLWLPISLSFPASLAASYVVFAATGAGMQSLPRAYAAASFFSLATAGLLMSRRGISLSARDLACLLAAGAALFALARWVAG